MNGFPVVITNPHILPFSHASLNPSAVSSNEELFLHWWGRRGYKEIRSLRRNSGTIFLAQVDSGTWFSWSILM